MTQSDGNTEQKGGEFVPPLDVQMDPLTALQFLLDCGVDETLDVLPVDRFALAAEKAEARIAEQSQAASSLRQRVAQQSMPQSAPPPVEAPQIKASGRAEATAAAEQVDTFESLRAALLNFEGCAHKATAQNAIFAQGSEAARVVFVGDAPTLAEDQQGQALVDRPGALFDKMLAAIGMARSDVAVSYIVPWRVPGDLSPNPSDLATMLPFTQRYVDLLAPKVVVPLGGLAAKTMMQRMEGITRLRGTWGDVATLSGTVRALPMYPPQYLLGTPAAKREAWHDLLSLQEFLSSSA